MRVMTPVQSHFQWFLEQHQHWHQQQSIVMLQISTIFMCSKVVKPDTTKPRYRCGSA
jgi:hypothetical protein